MILYNLWKAYSIVIVCLIIIRQVIKLAKSKNESEIVKNFIQGIIFIPVMTFTLIQK